MKLYDLAYLGISRQNMSSCIDLGLREKVIGLEALQDCAEGFFG